MKAGLEIHQQLDVGKLFSGKASIIEEGDPVSVSYRKLHVTVSELGESDAAAAAEKAKDHRFEYHGYPQSTGLVELDEEPPMDVNPRALQAAFQFARLCKAQLVDEVLVMRKIVIDGSNTSGFQRTMLYALDGVLTDPESGKAIPIPTMMLEEDSAKKTDALGRAQAAYNLSRLGIPLLEITTDPVFTDPGSLKRGALLIGSTLRLLSGVKRGLGTIRQDVNISVDGGSRCEIKGAQDVRTLDDLARQEVARQNAIIAFAKRIRDEELVVPEPLISDVTSVFVDSKAKVITSALQEGGRVLALSLPGFSQLLGLELSPNNRVGSELSGYVKAHTGLKGLFHSDELPKYGITEQDVERIRRLLELTASDAFILIAAPQKTARRGLVLALERLDMLTHGVPSEVRRAKPDNATEYLRAMPGSARMYPETDLVPFLSGSVVFTPARTRHELESSYAEKGISEEFTRIIIDSPLRSRFDELLEAHPAHGSLLAKAFFLYPKEAKTRHGVEPVYDERFEALVQALVEGRILEGSFVDALAAEDPLDVVFERFAPLDASEVEGQVRAIVEREKSKNPDVTVGALMGVVMRELGSSIDGKDAMRIIKGV
ncbi:MAG: Glu-tRNA(Gln) amidotransferase subunit GatE [Candidatus Woesearchaeota archaeon]